MIGPYLLRGLTDLILAAPRSLPVAMGALGLYGVGTSTGMVSYNSLLQAEVSSRNRGRVFAGYDMVWQTGRLISLGAGGLTADAPGIQAVYLLGGGLLLLADTIGLPRLSVRHPLPCRLLTTIRALPGPRGSHHRSVRKE